MDAGTPSTTARPDGIAGSTLPGPFPVGAYARKLQEELRKRAAELDIEGRSSMTKDELIDALRHH